MPKREPVEPERQCESINEELEIHFWPVSDPPAGTACKCGERTRQRGGAGDE